MIIKLLQPYLVVQAYCRSCNRIVIARRVLAHSMRKDLYHCSYCMSMNLRIISRDIQTPEGVIIRTIDKKDINSCLLTR